jgi:hypothetical protein
VRWRIAGPECFPSDPVRPLSDLCPTSVRIPSEAERRSDRGRTEGWQTPSSPGLANPSKTTFSSALRGQFNCGKHLSTRTNVRLFRNWRFGRAANLGAPTTIPNDSEYAQAGSRSHSGSIRYVFQSSRLVKNWASFNLWKIPAVTTPLTVTPSLGRKQGATMTSHRPPVGHRVTRSTALPGELNPGLGFPAPG